MIGKSNEHLRSPGTITYSAENLIRIWVEIGESVHRAGLRKMVIVNSHGGNIEVDRALSRGSCAYAGHAGRHHPMAAFRLPAGVYADFDAPWHSCG